MNISFLGLLVVASFIQGAIEMVRQHAMNAP